MLQTKVNPECESCGEIDVRSAGKLHPTRTVDLRRSQSSSDPYHTPTCRISHTRPTCLTSPSQGRGSQCGLYTPRSVYYSLTSLSQQTESTDCSTPSQGDSANGTPQVEVLQETTRSPPSVYLTPSSQPLIKDISPAYGLHGVQMSSLVPTPHPAPVIQIQPASDDRYGGQDKDQRLTTTSNRPGSGHRTPRIDPLIAYEMLNLDMTRRVKFLRVSQVEHTEQGAGPPTEKEVTMDVHLEGDPLERDRIIWSPIQALGITLALMTRKHFVCPVQSAYQPTESFGNPNYITSNSPSTCSSLDMIKARTMTSPYVSPSTTYSTCGSSTNTGPTASPNSPDVTSTLETEARGKKLFRTLCLGFVLLAVGCTTIIPPASFPDYISRIHSNTATGSLLFTSRRCGHLLGVACSTLLYPKVNQYVVFTVCLLSAGITTIICPLLDGHTAVISVMFLQGILIQTVEIGAYVLCVSVWDKLYPRYAQALYTLGVSGFGVGALLIIPFVNERAEIFPDSANSTDRGLLAVAGSFLYPQIIMGSLLVLMGLVFCSICARSERFLFYNKVKLDPQMVFVPKMTRFVVFMVGLFQFFYYGYIAAYVEYYQVFLVDRHHWAQSTGLLLITVHHTCATVSVIVFGVTVHILSPQAAIFTCHTLTICTLVLDLLLHQSWPLIVWLTTVIRGFSACIPPSSLSWIMIQMDMDSNVATTLSLLACLGAATTSTLIGRLFDFHGYWLFNGIITGANIASLVFLVVPYGIVCHMSRTSGEYNLTVISNESNGLGKTEQATVGDALGVDSERFKSTPLEDSVFTAIDKR